MNSNLLEVLTATEMITSTLNVQAGQQSAKRTLYDYDTLNKTSEDKN